jgi:Leucine-rich repeat (LRR) protein
VKDGDQFLRYNCDGMNEGGDARGVFAGIAKKVKMGKRVEKAMKEKASTSASQETAEEDANKAPEPYTCTGNFEADFSELCRRGGLPATEIPPVMVRAKRPGTPPPPDPKASTEEPADAGEEEPKPKTYTTRERFAYFKPCIQVEMENEDKPATVTEIYIRGWKIDNMMVEIFRSCFPTIEKLNTINFWNVGLTDKTLRDLASFLPQCPNLKNIVIEANPIPEEPWACLLGEDSLVVNLSLRHNDITDRGASGIGAALSTVNTCNKNLISLNLSHNKFSDVGAEAIVKGLRMNRVLLCLSLASNKITDKGAVKFGEVLSRFALTHEEVVERRKLLSDKGSPDRGSGKSPPPSRGADSKDRPGSVRSGSHMDKDKKRDKSSKKKDGKKDKDDGTKGGTKKEDKWKKGEQWPIERPEFLFFGVYELCTGSFCLSVKFFTSLTPPLTEQKSRLLHPGEWPAFQQDGQHHSHFFFSQSYEISPDNDPAKEIFAF